MTRKMKDSGIEWIGMIPENWKQFHFKYIISAKIDNRGRTPTLNEDNIGIPIIELNAIGTKNPNLNNVSKFISKESYDKFIRNDLLAGDVLFGTVGSIGKCSIVPEGVDYCIAQNIVGYRFNSENDPLYWYFYFGSDAFKLSFMQYNKGNVLSSIKISDMERAMVVVPPLCEQKKIARFLDVKVEEINTIISKTKESIEEYKKYRQAVITEAVTKGLDKTVSMKDSGLEWIGQIPIDWKTVKIKYTSWLKGRIGWQGLKSNEYQDEGAYLITGTDFSNGVINWDSCVHISDERFEEAPEIHIKEADLLITKDGTIGKVAIAKDCPEKVSLNSGVLLIRNTKDFKYHDKYLYFVLLSNQFWVWYEMSQTGNSTIKHLYQEQFYNFEFTYPSMEEQQRIAEYLEKQVEDIDALIAKKEAFVEEMETYKKSLIYEYVTGKKEVL